MTKYNTNYNLKILFILELQNRYSFTPDDLF